MASRRTGTGGRSAIAAALLLALPLSGCYTLAPVDPGSPAPVAGASLRMTLTDAGSQALTGQLGPGVRGIDGTLDRATPEAYSVFVRSVDKRNGDQDTWNGEPVTIPRDAVATVSLRRLDRTRSFLVAGAVAIGAVVVGRAFGSSTIFGGSDGGGDPTPGN